MQETQPIILIGPMGAGKTSAGRLLAEHLGFEFLDSDECIKKNLDMTITEMFSRYGEHFFRTQESLVLQQVISKSNIVFATGGGVVLSETNRSLLKSGLVCYLKVQPIEQQRRLQFSQDRPLLPATLKLQIPFFESIMKQRNSYYQELAQIVINTDEISVPQVAQRLFSIFEEQYVQT